MRRSSPLCFACLLAGFSTIAAGQLFGDLLPTLQLPTLPTLSLPDILATTDAPDPTTTDAPQVTTTHNGGGKQTTTNKITTATQKTTATSAQTTNAPGKTTAPTSTAIPTTQQPSTLLTSTVDPVTTTAAITNTDPNSTLIPTTSSPNPNPNPSTSAVPDPPSPGSSKLSTADIAGICVGAFFLTLFLIASLIPTIRRWRSRPERTHQSLDDDPFGIHTAHTARLETSFAAAPRITEIRRKELPKASITPTSTSPTSTSNTTPLPPLQTMTAIAVTTDGQSGRRHGAGRGNVLASIPEARSPQQSSPQQQRGYRPEVFEMDASANPMQSRQRSDLAAGAGFLPQGPGGQAPYSSLPEVSRGNGGGYRGW